MFEISPIKLEKNLTEIGAVSHAKKIYFYSVIHKKKTKEEESTVDSALMRKIEIRGQEPHPTSGKLHTVLTSLSLSKQSKQSKQQES